MKRIVVVVCVLAPFVGMAGGFANSYRLTGGTVAVTNAQANSSWVPVAVLVKFDAAATGAAAVRRESQGTTFTLSSCSFVSATNLVWVAERDYSFGFGDVLVIESTVTTGVVQVLRKGD